MKKKVLSLSIAAMIGGLGFAAAEADEASVVIVPGKNLLPEGSVYYQGVVHSLLVRGWI